MGQPRPADGPRAEAWRILLDWEAGRGSAEQLREARLARGDLTASARAAITDLTQGVLRHRLYLRHQLAHHLTKPWDNLPVGARTALLLGAYQLLCAPEAARHAAVMETVQVLKGTSFAGFTGLVNAVLRKIARGETAPLPVGAEERLSVRHSMPPWLVAALGGQLPDGELEDLLASLNRPPTLTLRVNTLRSTREQLLAQLTDVGIKASPGRLSPSALVLEGSMPPDSLAPLAAGMCTVQDEGAQLPVLLLGPMPGEKILDACAAPGGKAGQMCEAMAGEGLVVAADRQQRRLGTLRRNLSRLGHSDVYVLAADLLAPPFAAAGFDRILLDAPCSGTGVLRRHPEGKWRKDPGGIEELAALQRGMIAAAAGCLRPGGRLLYCTCSLLKEENEAVVEHCQAGGALRLIDMRPGCGHLPEDVFTERGELRLWPHRHGSDGFYGALLERA